MPKNNQKRKDSHDSNQPVLSWLFVMGHLQLAFYVRIEEKWWKENTDEENIERRSKGKKLFL